MHEGGIKKLYYSISEVSEMTGLDAHVLRYWETEFDELKPKKNRAGRRVYTMDDINMVLRVKKLLRDDKYTIEGARQVLARSKNAGSPSIREREKLEELKGFLIEILQRLP
jgi:DNA-binding transcriptional MerR regulator